MIGGYILSIAGIVLLSAVISVIAPGGKMGKFVKGMTRLFIFVVLVAPFVKLVRDPEALLPSAEIGVDRGYLSVYTDMLSRADEREIAALLRAEFGVEAEVSVSRSFDDLSYEKIIVRIFDLGINGDEAHIDILSAIGERLEKIYGCKAEVS